MISVQNSQNQSRFGLSLRSRLHHLAGVAIAAIGVVVMLPPIAQAQITADQMRSFPMPPTRGYINLKEGTGDFSKTLARPAYISVSSMAENFEYVRYTDIQGKNFLDFFGFPVVYRPSGLERDLCHGTTFTTGTWIKYRQVGLTGPSSIIWRFIKGYSGDGVRSDAHRGQCGLEGGWSTKPALSSTFDFRAPVPLFGWVAEEVVIGNLQLSRNGGGCGYPSCYMPSRYIRTLVTWE
jgi:hypothetical protein